MRPPININSSNNTKGTPVSNYTYVNTFSDLPDVTTADKNVLYLVGKNQGVWGVNRKPKGLYRIIKKADNTYEYSLVSDLINIRSDLEAELNTKASKKDNFIVRIINNSNTKTTHDLASDTRYLLDMGSSYTNSSGNDELKLPTSPKDGDLIELQIGVIHDSLQWNIVGGTIDGTTASSASPYGLTARFYRNDILRYTYNSTNSEWNESVLYAGDIHYITTGNTKHKNLPENTTAELNKITRHMLYKVANIDTTSTTTQQLNTIYGTRLPNGGNGAVACQSTQLNGIYEITKSTSGTVTVNRLITNHAGLTIQTNNNDVYYKYNTTTSTYNEVSYPFTLTNKNELADAYNNSLEHLNRIGLTDTPFAQQQRMQFKKRFGTEEEMSLLGTSKYTGLFEFRLTSSQTPASLDHFIFNGFDSNYLGTNGKTTLEVLVVLPTTDINSATKNNNSVEFKLGNSTKQVLYFHKKGTTFNGGNPFAETVEYLETEIVSNVIIVRIALHFEIDTSDNQFIYAHIDNGQYTLTNENITFSFRHFKNYINPTRFQLKVIGNTYDQKEIDNLLAAKLDSSDVENSLTSTSTTKALSAAQGKALNDDKIPFSDIVDGMQAGDNSRTKPVSAAQTRWLYVNTLKLSDIVNNITSDNTNKALSAKQGKELKALIDSITSSGGSTPLVNNLDSDRTDAGLTALQGHILGGLIDQLKHATNTTHQPAFYDLVRRGVHGDRNWSQTESSNQYTHLRVYRIDSPETLGVNQHFRMDNLHTGPSYMDRNGGNSKVTLQFLLYFKETYANKVATTGNRTTISLDSTTKLQIDWEQGSNTKGSSNITPVDVRGIQAETTFIVSVTLRSSTIQVTDVTEYFRGKMITGSLQNATMGLSVKQYAGVTVEPWQWIITSIIHNFVNVANVLTTRLEILANRDATDKVLSANSFVDLMNHRAATIFQQDDNTNYIKLCEISNINHIKGDTISFYVTGRGDYDTGEETAAKFEVIIIKRGQYQVYFLDVLKHAEAEGGDIIQPSEFIMYYDTSKDNGTAHIWMRQQKHKANGAPITGNAKWAQYNIHLGKVPTNVIVNKNPAGFASIQDATYPTADWTKVVKKPRGDQRYLETVLTYGNTNRDSITGSTSHSGGTTWMDYYSKIKSKETYIFKTGTYIVKMGIPVSFKVATGNFEVAAQILYKKTSDSSWTLAPLPSALGIRARIHGSAQSTNTGSTANAEEITKIMTLKAFIDLTQGDEVEFSFRVANFDGSNVIGPSLANTVYGKKEFWHITSKYSRKL